MTWRAKDKEVRLKKGARGIRDRIKMIEFKISEVNIFSEVKV